MSAAAYQGISPYLAAAICAALAYVALCARSARARLPLPPGPRPLPIIGNTLDMPVRAPWVTFRAWTAQYGDVVYFNAFGKHFVLLGSVAATRDLLDKRANFASRPRTPMFNDLMGFGWMLGFLPYGARLRELRSALRLHAHGRAARAYMPVQLAAGRRFACALGTAQRHGAHVLRALVAAHVRDTVLQMAYGIGGADVAHARLAQDIIDAASRASLPGRYLVDLIPALKGVPAWMPGAGFRREAAQARANHQRMREWFFDTARAQAAAADAPASIVQAMLGDTAAEADAHRIQLIKDLAGTLHIAAFDTTSGAILSCVLAMALYPEVQRRAQEELDRVVGRGRMPEFGDMDALPYIHALIGECLRWMPAVPLGLPHATMHDDEYRGHFIPKGSIVFAAQWAMMHDPSDYPDPSAFQPERYLTRPPSGGWARRDDVSDPRAIAFGFGRRACPGTSIAQQGLFATLAPMLHTLDILPVAEGKGIPRLETDRGLLALPEPFDYAIRIRSDAEGLINTFSEV